MALPNVETIVAMSEAQVLELLDRQLAQVNFPLSHDQDLTEARQLIACRRTLALARKPEARA